MSYLDDAKATQLAPRIPVAAPSDYFRLLKPRVMSLVVLTALAGILLAPVPPHPFIAFTALLAIAVGAGASGALNMWYDADIDAVMTRTATRPIPAGRMEPESALAFGLVLAMLSVFTLGFATNWLAAALLAFTIFFYVVIYTMWLKRSTPQNIVIGGAAGALPPMVGYAAATGDISLASVVLFAIIFIWTPPHFWALAIMKHDDYGRAGVPMMPNVHGPDRTRTEILVYSILLAPLGAAPWLLGFASPVYGVVSAAAGSYLLWLAVQVYRRREGDAARRASLKLFLFSISYLFLLFLIIVGERALHLAGVV
ncbi:heme o synthase [Methylocystis parvus]|uniref:Protoheme IX farnesyltransferase n=1 Tax=Methylocystis parvus TaxID=134 RepID=A0A6B8M3S3_9HYPH|nr:heme o synthase [Methylocystis parvus]QGM96389.1 protoheme IX farnesyltransferase [Methylocystis parvus]WBJ99768.1 heme o synthase [Methylocystis parvus OBBP]